mmetsp:Transcript_98/g.180  ORF Transcript_98/g.180 Transcript_98/m.180 type:complete len:259 (-) Transcript_98:470-1246(-)
MAQVDAPVLRHQVGLGLALVRRRRHRGRHLALAIDVNDDAILGELLLDENDLLRALDDEVPPRVQRALSQSGELLLRLAGQHAVGAAQHDGNAADHDAADAVLAPPRHDLLPSRVLNVHTDGRCVRHVPQAALLRRDVLHNEVFLVRRLADVYVQVFEIKVGVGIAGDLLVGLRVDDFLDFLVDEIVKRVDVLAHEPPHLQEVRQQLIFVLDALDRRHQFLARVAPRLFPCELLLLFFHRWFSIFFHVDVWFSIWFGI